MAFNPSAKQLKGIKAAIFLLALVPLARMVWLTATGQLVEPLEFITRGTGDWTLYFLCITLAVTPLRRLSKMNWLIKLRRMFGLYAFFYAFLHFMTFFWFDHFFDIAGMFRDVAKRPFILVGFTAFVLLIPLAVTSTNAMVKRLGGKRWLWLHRLIYLIAPLGILHFWWMRAGKSNFTEPFIFGVIVAVLLGARVYWSWAGAKSPAPGRHSREGGNP
ncbi:sulfite oxidase heme-binding subunit YedZ [Massilia sp. GCM10020059]|uniref:Protein-methionine-sulfoxide reductase heme-binding subunit MsrQ n=1 Tax=Massilia agrisoli TaxID=2892444 RepID=A0ABS8IQ44_9BURK|nr:protein-methionine-sulfoxide reductase heme-binding subunit MsrQ [Massilia agrisoli]MCC6069394.1 sulfoxide reductase heme-binding subunit YedZ [Massilia agrisoli]